MDCRRQSLRQGRPRFQPSQAGVESRGHTRPGRVPSHRPRGIARPAIGRRTASRVPPGRSPRIVAMHGHRTPARGGTTPPHRHCEVRSIAKGVGSTLRTDVRRYSSGPASAEFPLGPDSIPNSGSGPRWHRRTCRSGSSRFPRKGRRPRVGCRGGPLRQGARWIAGSASPSAGSRPSSGG